MTGTGTEPTNDVRTAKRAAMRRATLHLVLGIVVLHTIAMLVYYAAIVHAPERARMIFTGTWTALTAVVVAVLLKRVRRVRRGEY
jgi:drug/metabolite transporter (DMT)-like permease